MPERPMKLRPGIELLAETVGSGVQVGKGDRVRVRLRAWLNRGELVQETESVDIEIGRRRVIPGLELSLEGMRLGGTRRVRISPHLAYRERGVGDRIPPSAALVYEIELLEVMERI